MKYFVITIVFIFIIGCSSKQSFGPDVVNKTVERASSDGMLIIYNQGGSNDFINFRLIRDQENAFLELVSQFGFKIADVYKKGDSLWVVVPTESTVYFQYGSNYIQYPGFNIPGFPIGMIFDIMGANFTFSYSLISEDDLRLIDAVENMRYTFYGGQLTRTEYKYGNMLVNKAFTYSGRNIKVNVRRNNDLMMTVNVNNLRIEGDINPSRFDPKYPDRFKYVEL